MLNVIILHISKILRINIYRIYSVSKSYIHIGHFAKKQSSELEVAELVFSVQKSVFTWLTDEGH